jgi:hypothetical protein
MTYEECLVTRQVLDQDRRFAGTLFSRRKWGADNYSIQLRLKNEQELEFNALSEFRDWHAQYRKGRGPANRERRYMAHASSA